jgi:hypothetical protein
MDGLIFFFQYLCPGGCPPNILRKSEGDHGAIPGITLDIRYATANNLMHRPR